MTDNAKPRSRPEDAAGPLSRRTVVVAGGVATASAALLAAACSTAAKQSVAPVAQTEGVPAQGAGTPLGPASSVPVGGGRVFAQQKVVVTQPTAGQFKGFSAICTHQGCTVNSVSNGTINCPCHGSRYNIADGSVAHGPAPAPLPPRPVSADGGVLRLT